VSVKGDARSQAPSSGAATFQRLLSTCDRYAGPGFAGFVLLHFACQAFRARSGGALPQAGFEAQPAVVAGSLLVIWLPFVVFAWRALRRGPSARAESEKARALAILEQVTLGLVLLFLTLHLSQVAWPLLSGALAPSDVRPELIAQLSSTQHGAPLLAAAYLCGVGAAAFLGARQALLALRDGRPRVWARAVVALGVLAYLLGSYAVIRCASGVILP
jgi:hypothetical protein